MTDRVHYALPLGPLGRRVHAVYGGRQLGHIFDFRQQILARHCAGDAASAD